MNGNDIVIHIEHCSECQQRQSKMESGSENAKAELESQIELCLINNNLNECNSFLKLNRKGQKWHSQKSKGREQ